MYVRRYSFLFRSLILRGDLFHAINYFPRKSPENVFALDRDEIARMYHLLCTTLTRIAPHLCTHIRTTHSTQHNTTQMVYTHNEALINELCFVVGFFSIFKRYNERQACNVDETLSTTRETSDMLEL